MNTFISSPFFSEKEKTAGIGGFKGPSSGFGFSIHFFNIIMTNEPVFFLVNLSNIAVGFGFEPPGFPGFEGRPSELESGTFRYEFQIYVWTIMHSKCLQK